MGVSLSFLPFFDICHQRRAILSPLLALGSLEIQESGADIISFAHRNSYANLGREKSVRSLFLERYGIESYVDCDLNDRAAFKIDITKPIHPILVHAPRTILNAGTLEHIFDVAGAIVNVHDVLSVGGTIIHISPVSWYDHAFFNFNPRLFRSIVTANDYDLVAEAFWIPCRPSLLDRIGLTSPNADGKVYVTYDGHETQESSEIRTKLSGPVSFPANCLHMICYRKTHDAAFQLPYDVSP